MLTLRKLWNTLTKKNSGKSRVKNYDMAEAVLDLVEMIAEERAERGYSEVLMLLHEKSGKLAEEIIKLKKAQPPQA